jgi:hypothetical protein
MLLPPWLLSHFFSLLPPTLLLLLIPIPCLLVLALLLLHGFCVVSEKVLVDSSLDVIDGVLCALTKC